MPRGVNSGAIMDKKTAEEFFGRKASPDVNLSPKEFLKKNPPFKPLTDLASRVKGKVIDEVSDAMSYSARHKAQIAMNKADNDVVAIKKARTIRDQQLQALPLKK